MATHDGGGSGVSVDLWLASLDREPAHPGWLDAVEATRAARIVDPAHRARYVARRCFTRGVLAQVTDRRPADLRLERRCEHCGQADHGRPRLLPDGPHFSVSSSGNVAALATCASVEVGIDVVDLTALREVDITPRLIEVAFGEFRTDCANPVGFAAAWARQEAVGKCWGYGLIGLPAAAQLDSTCFEVDLAVPGREMMCAVAVRRPDLPVTVVRRRPAPPGGNPGTVVSTVGRDKATPA